MFNIQPLEAPKMLAFPQLRFDVDTHQDLKFLNGICSKGVDLDSPANLMVEFALQK